MVTPGLGRSKEAHTLTPCVESASLPPATVTHTQKKQTTTAWAWFPNYKWSHSDLVNIEGVLRDQESQLHREKFRNAVADLSDTNTAALLFNENLHQGISRICPIMQPNNREKQKYAQWYDRECRVLRARAIDAGHRVSNTNDKCCQLEACQKYRACVQKKHREHKNKCLAEIETTYTVDRDNLWKVIDRRSGSKSVATEQSDSEFFNHFTQLSNGQALPTFSVEYEAKALAFFLINMTQTITLMTIS